MEDGIKSGRLIDTHLLQTLIDQQSSAGTSQRKPAVKKQETLLGRERKLDDARVALYFDLDRSVVCNRFSLYWPV